MPAPGGRWGCGADQRVQQLRRQVRVKEERIVELEAENAILHLKLAEKLKRDLKEFHSSSLGLVRNYQDAHQACMAEIAAAVKRAQLSSEALQARQSREVHLEKSLQEIKEQYQIEKEKRRLLHNRLVELKGNIRVHCRIRPVLPFDSGFDDPALQSSSLCEKVIHAVDDETVLVKCKRPGHPLTDKTYNFERVYGPAESQRTVFEEIRPLLISLLDGYSVCVMAAGPSGSGKSYTMLGRPASPAPAARRDPHGDVGVVPRVAEELFRLISENPSRSPKVEVSIVEVYNNEIFDLLAKDISTLVPRVKRGMRTSTEGQKEVPLLAHEQVGSAAELTALVATGLQLRAWQPTRVHGDSSRSHLLVTVTLSPAGTPGCTAPQPDPAPVQELICPSVPPTVRGQGPKAAHSTSSSGPAPLEPAEPQRPAPARLQLVDLAGSECAGVSGVTGPALRETAFINRSLAALAGVLDALAEHRAHVPYRDSKLTHLLQDSIGGDAKLLLIVCVSPCRKHLAESLQSLAFGARARQVPRGPVRRRRSAGARTRKGEPGLG
ncbi:kinesin-like protein KIF25 isoform X2 [Tamandua tetradactyla]|uniref:kinesin-like protein KIF25 isoform X2 n=1 Tax=Tamandua tetradactyla TaxID=48850 RepID=UPI0040540FBD